MADKPILFTGAMVRNIDDAPLPAKGGAS